MTSGHVFIAMSLDGFVARKNHKLDWLMKHDTEGEDHGYDAFMASVDGLVMGRGSFETVLGFDAWPYAKPVVVMSQTLTDAEVPAELRDKVRLSRAAPRELMTELAAEGWNRAYVDGGKLVQSFVREGLVHDMSITIIPMLLGDGIRLFGPTDGDVDLELVATTSFPSGLVNLQYRLGA